LFQVQMQTLPTRLLPLLLLQQLLQRRWCRAQT
jgi:hypothetical protein